MQNLNKLFVFTNSRKIREFNAKFQNELIPKAMTIAEFEKKSMLVKDRFEADETYLLVLMQQACASVKAASERLKIPGEFFAFLKNNDYLFSFFKELAISKKSIAELKFSDIYADYEEHLSILEEVLARYKELLVAQNLYDGICLPEIYEINEGFVGEFSEINLEIDGFLSEFEWELVGKIANLTTLKIVFQTSKFNQKLISKLSEISGIEIKKFSPYAKFELNLSDKILTKLEDVWQNLVIEKRAFAVRGLQAAYAMAKVSEFVAQGIKPENIAVILPDESFCEILRLHDSENLFNFAMGESFADSKFYQILNCIATAINDKISVVLDTKRYQEFNEFEFILSEFGVSWELFLGFKNGFEASCEFEKFKELIKQILALQDERAVAEKVGEELFYVQSLARYFSFTLRQICEIFLMKLGGLRLDHVGGGKVSVMGVLESRGLKFDGVILLDFNDDLVPKRSINEMFLSSAVRQKAGLIGYLDRENLQRFYYESLINSAKKAAICYVQNEEKIASRFLNEFNAMDDARFSDESYLALLNGEFETAEKFDAGKVGQQNLSSEFDPSGAGAKAVNLTRKTPAKPKEFENEIILKHNFFASPLSFSRLNTFLQCPRRYYYEYILQIDPPKMPQIRTASQFGVALHEALREYYSKFERFDLNEFEKVLSNAKISPLEREITMIKMQKFKESEDERYEQGWRVKELERWFESKFLGVTIVGVIDRIDAREGELAIIDYKSGKFEPKSLQLPFYEALLGEPCQSFYYDLKDSMRLVASNADVSALGEAIEYLKSINNTPINFGEAKGAMSEYDDYKILVKGEL